MTDARPGRLDAHEERIRVAIHAYLANPQNVAARFTLLPEFVSRAAEEHHFSGALCLCERLGIHEAEHQHIAGALVLDDGRHQPAAFLKVDFHGVVS